MLHYIILRVEGTADEAGRVPEGAARGARRARQRRRRGVRREVRVVFATRRTNVQRLETMWFVISCDRWFKRACRCTPMRMHPCGSAGLKGNVQMCTGEAALHKCSQKAWALAHGLLARGVHLLTVKFAVLLSDSVRRRGVRTIWLVCVLNCRWPLNVDASKTASLVTSSSRRDRFVPRCAFAFAKLWVDVHLRAHLCDSQTSNN